MSPIIPSRHNSLVDVSFKRLAIVSTGISSMTDKVIDNFANGVVSIMKISRNRNINYIDLKSIFEY